MALGAGERGLICSALWSIWPGAGQHQRRGGSRVSRTGQDPKRGSRGGEVRPPLTSPCGALSLLTTGIRFPRGPSLPPPKPSLSLALSLSSLLRGSRKLVLSWA